MDENNPRASLSREQADMIALTIGILAQMDMMGREKGLGVDYKRAIAQTVGNLTAVFGLEFIRECQKLLQDSAMQGPSGERLIVSGNGHG